MGMIGNTLAQGLISGANIQDGTVDTADIKSNAITPSKLSIGGLTWDSNSNVGIGVTPSAWGGGQVGLQVKNASLSGFSNSAYVMANTYYDGTSEKYIASSFAAKYAQASGAHIWYTAPSGTAGNAIAFTQAMTLGANGFLGIGQTSPAWAVDILADTGNLLVRQTRARVIDTERNLGGIICGGYSTGTTIVDSAQIAFASSGAWTSTSAPSYMVFSTTASGSTTMTERARIDSSGRFGIGTASPAYPLDVYTNNSADALRLMRNNAPGTGAGPNVDFSVTQTNSQTARLASVGAQFSSGWGGNLLFYTKAADSNPGTTFVERGRFSAAGDFQLYITPAKDGQLQWTDNAGGSVRAFIYANGNPELIAQCGGSGGVKLTSGATSWVSASDIRSKDIIEPITNAVTKVATLSAIIYSFKDDEQQTRRVGLVAQELLEVLPEAVHVPTKEGELLGVRYAEVVPLLVAAIKELNTRLAALEGA